MGVIEKNGPRTEHRNPKSNGDQGKRQQCLVYRELRLLMAQPSSDHTINVYRKEKLRKENSDITIINGAC